MLIYKYEDLLENGKVDMAELILRVKQFKESFPFACILMLKVQKPVANVVSTVAIIMTLLPNIATDALEQTLHLGGGGTK